MEGALRVAPLSVLVAVGACTMIGSPELAEPPGPGSTPIPAGEARRAELPSRRGNMERYEQSGGTYRVMESSRGYDERGIASWYGDGFHGRPTSSGEIFDMHRVSAAHRTLPLPSWVEVTNLANGRRLVVRVNDRGPFHEPSRRIIDLSYAAARELGMVRTGTASVRVRSVEPWQTRTR